MHLLAWIRAGIPFMDLQSAFLGLVMIGYVDSSQCDHGRLMARYVQPRLAEARLFLGELPRRLNVTPKRTQNQKPAWAKLVGLTSGRD